MPDLDDVADAYARGRTMAYRRMLGVVLSEIGYDPQVAETSYLELVGEHIDTQAALRQVCATYGDNDWPDTLYLADVVEKHLHRNLNRDERLYRGLLLRIQRELTLTGYTNEPLLASLREALE